MKKRVGMFLAATMAAFGAWAATETVGDYTWTYRINGDTAEVYKGSSSPAISPKPTGAVTIPSTLGGKPVTSIGNYAFCNCSGLTSVTIPDSVTSIGYQALSGCSGLTSVTIPDSVTSIGERAFSGCTGLTSVTIPDGVTSIGSYAFDGCSGLMSISVGTGNVNYKSVNGLLLSKDGKTLIRGVNGDVNIPDSVTSIEYGAFSGYSGLTSVTIPDNVTSIGSYAFYGCSDLVSVTIPNSVTSIGWDAFYGCSGLTSVTIGKGVTSIGSSAFSGCSGLTSVTIPQYVCTNRLSSVFSHVYQSITNVVIWGNVTSIGSSAFYDCSGLTSVTIPDSVTSIGFAAFYGCSRLMSISVGSGNVNYKSVNGLLLSKDGQTLIKGVNGDVNIPDGVTSIGDSAFSRCSGLTSVTIPDSVTSIGEHAFSGCSGLTSVTIPGSVTSIGYCAFSGCSGLTSVTIPNSVTSIGGAAFEDCSGLMSVTIPDSVTSIGSEAFRGCSGFTSITLPFVGSQRGNSGTSDSLFGYIFGTSSYTGGTKTQQYYSSGSFANYYIPTALKTVTITDETALGYGAFYGCSGLTSVTIPDSVTSIGYEAFNDCDSLFDTTTIPGVKLVDGWAVGNTGSLSGSLNLTGIRGIGYCAFSGCSGLTSVTIPNSVTSIGGAAFSGCSGLTSVTIPNSVTSIESCAFEGCSGLTSVTIPDSVTSIGGSAFWGCRDSLFDKTTIPGVKLVDGWAVGNTGSLSGNLNLTGIRGIGYSAFYNCDGLMSVTIGNSVTSIGNEAFEDCSGLTSVTIGNGVTSIGSEAFSYCRGLTSVTMPDSVTSIGERAFYFCSGLTSVTIGNGVTSIGSEAFSYCSGLTSVHITDIAKWCGISFESYDRNPLYYAHNLYLNNEKITDLTIPDGVTSIGNYAFSGCSGLASVTIPDSVTSIGASAFSGCSGLASVTIGNGVTSIGSGAFFGCSGLMSISVGTGNVNYKSVNGLLLSKDGKTLIKGVNGDVNIPDSVTSIGSSAFSGCSGLTSVTIPDSVTSIGSSAFYGCSDLVSVTIPNSVTSIGDCAFYNCSGLTSVTIPDSVTSIRSSAFSGCSGLTSVTIPNSVTSIGEYAFRACSGLTSVAIPNSVTSIGSSAFSGCSGLTSITLPFVGSQRGNSGTSDSLFGYIFGTSSYTGGTKTKQYYSSVSYSYYFIPAALKTVTITDETVLGYGAFYGCRGLTSVTIPDSVTRISQDAFSGCGPISVTIPNGLTEIGSCVFRNSGLTSVTIPDSVTSIGDSAFSGCRGLTSVTIPDSVTSIGSEAFSYCSGLTSVTIPDSVTSIGEDAFCYCSGLTSVHITNLAKWCGISFIGYDSNPLYFAHNLYLNGEKVTDLTIPDGVTRIKSYAFSGCSSLTSVTIPNSVTSIGSSAFSGCSGLTSITLPFVGSQRGNSGTSDSLFGYIFGTSSYTGGTKTQQYYSSGSFANYYIPTALKTVTITDETALGYGAFYGCSGLTSVTIPDSVTSIGSSAFSGCSGLTSVCVSPGDVERIKGLMTSSGFNVSGIRFIESIVVSFDANGGSVDEQMRAVLSGNAIGTLPTPARTGHTFEGWWTAASGGTQISASATVSGNVTYYAHWTVNQYTVTFDANGGTGGTTKTQDYGTSLSAPTVTRTGYTFAGWQPEPLATVPVYDVTYTAQWTVNQYRVAFNANGGAGAMAEQPMTYDVSATLSENTFRNGDMIFRGWALTAGGKVAYREQASVRNLSAIPDDVVTLYAVWQAKPAAMLACEEVFGGAGTVTLDENDNAVVTLTNDVSGTVEIPDNVGSVTIDLNGHNMVGGGGLGETALPDGPAIKVVKGDGEGEKTSLAIGDTSDGEKGQIAGGGESAGIEIAEGAAHGMRLDVDDAVPVLNGDGTEQDCSLLGRGSLPWPSDGAYNPLVANVYDGYIVDDDGALTGIIQVKAAKQTVKSVTDKVTKVKSATTNVAVTATVTDAAGKKWSYKGVGSVDGVVTGLVCTTKGALVPSFGVSLGANGLEGEWGDFAVAGARNGMGTKGDAMMTALDANYKKSWSVALANEQGVTRLQLVVGAKGSTKISGVTPDGFKISATVQGIMGEDAFFVPYFATLKNGKLTRPVHLLLTLGKDGAVVARTSDLGGLMAAGPTTDEIEVQAYAESASSKGGEAYAGAVVLNELAYPAKFAAKGLPAGLKIDAATGAITGVPTKPGRYTATITVTSGVNGKKKVETSVDFDIGNYTDETIDVADSYSGYCVGVMANAPIAAAIGCTVSGLPAGLKFAAKETKDNTFGTVAAGTVYGVPTKAGEYTVYFKKSEKVNGKSVTHQASATFKVEALPEWAQGTFNGNVKCRMENGELGDGGEQGGGFIETALPSGMVTLTVDAKGKISGKLIDAGGTWTLSAAAYERVDGLELGNLEGLENLDDLGDLDDLDDLVFHATVIGKNGKKAITNEVTVAMDDAARSASAPYRRGVVSGWAASEPPVEWTAWQNLWKTEPWKSDAKVYAKAPKLTVGEIELKFGASGAVTAKYGKYSCSTVLISAEDGTFFVFLYFPPKVGKFDGYGVDISLTWDADGKKFSAVEQ